MIDLEKQVKRASLPVLVLFIIIAGMLAISLYYLYDGIRAYMRGALEDAFYYTLLAAAGIGLSLYMVYTIRKRALSQKQLPKVITTIECKRCSFKSLRQFEKGDYVFRLVEKCQKCNEPMLITAIYAEAAKTKR